MGSVLNKCDEVGGSCFIAGTQVVVKASASALATGKTPLAGIVPDPHLRTMAALPSDSEQRELDAWFAAVAATIGSGLLLERRRRHKQYSPPTAAVPVT